MSEPLLYIAVVAAAESRGFFVHGVSFCEGIDLPATVDEMQLSQCVASAKLLEGFGERDLMRAFAAVGEHRRRQFTLYPAYGDDCTPEGGKSFTMAFAADLFLREIMRRCGDHKNSVSIFDDSGLHIPQEDERTDQTRLFRWKRIDDGVIVCVLGEIGDGNRFTWGTKDPEGSYGAKLKRVSEWLSTVRPRAVVYVVPQERTDVTTLCIGDAASARGATTLHDLVATMAGILKEYT